MKQIALIFMACFSLVASAQEKVVTISQPFQSLLSLPLYVAIHQGFFHDQKLSVIKETSGSPSAALGDVLSGSSEFSIHSPDWIATGGQSTSDVRVIANLVNRASAWIATTPDLQFNSIKDIQGQKVVSGLMPTTSTSLLIRLLRQNGMNENVDIDLIQVRLGTEYSALLNGRAKVAVLYEPGLDQVVAKGMKVALSFPMVDHAYVLSAISAKKSVDPVAAQRLVNGIEMALRYLKTNKEGSIQIAKKEFPYHDPQVIENAVNRMINENVFASSVEISPEALANSFETQIYLGTLQKQPAYGDIVNDQFIKKALVHK